MKKLIVLAGCTALLSTAHSQTFGWAKQLGGTTSDLCRDVATDAAGNVYSTGSFQGTVDFDPGAGTANLTSAGASDIYISKFDASGNYVWALRIGGTTGDEGNGIALDASGNIYLTGYFRGTVDFDPGAGVVSLGNAAGTDGFVLKLDATGAFTWVKQIGGNSNDHQGNRITVDGSGNVYTTGKFVGQLDFDPGAGTVSLGIAASTMPQYYVQVLNVLGDYVWAKYLGNSNSTIYGFDIEVNAAGEVYTCGYFQSTGLDFDPSAASATLSSSNYDIYVNKWSSTGSYLWAKKMGGPNNDEALGLVLDAGGNVYSTGFFYNTGDFDPGAGNISLSSLGSVADLYLLKLDAAGAYSWAGVFGSNASGDCAYSIFVDASTHIYSTGFYQGTVDFDPGAAVNNTTSGGQRDAYVHKMEQCATPNAPVNATPAANLLLCGSGSTTLWTTGAGVLGWYSDPIGGTYLGGGTSFITPVLSNDTVFYVQDSTCMSGPRTAIAVTFSPAMSATLSAQTNLTCFGSNDGTATVSVSGGTPSYAYTWAPTGGNSATGIGLPIGVFTCTITDAPGCTQTQTVFITQPSAVDVSTTLTGNMLSANQNGAVYQWIDCLNGNTPVAGATSQTFTPQANGDYAVIVTVGPCSDTSACTNVITGIEIAHAALFSLYPNPTNGSVTIQLSGNASNTAVEIFNATGQLVKTEMPTRNTVTVELPADNGIYLIRVTVNGISTSQKVIKE